MIKVDDLAKLWNVSASTIYNLVESGKLACYRIGTGRGAIRFTDEQIAAFLVSCKVTPASSLPEGLKHIRSPS